MSRTVQYSTVLTEESMTAQLSEICLCGPFGQQFSINTSLFYSLNIIDLDARYVFHSDDIRSGHIQHDLEE